MVSKFAPVAVFAYRRVNHLSRTLDALERCPEFSTSPVFVYSDGPRPGDDQATADVAAVRASVRARLRPNMRLEESAVNRGLAMSIERAVGRLADEYGQFIVIEDDLVVAPCALTWLNAGLVRFGDAPNVWQISAYQFDVPLFAQRDTGMFLKFATCWGWASWKRAWDHYDPAATGWEALGSDALLRKRFDVGGYPYSDMLCRQMSGSIDSWAIRWLWTVFRAEGVVLFPPEPSSRISGTTKLRRIIA